MPTSRFSRSVSSITVVRSSRCWSASWFPSADSRLVALALIDASGDPARINGRIQFVDAAEIGVAYLAIDRLTRKLLNMPMTVDGQFTVVDRHFEAAWSARTHGQRARDRAAGHPSYRMIRFADDFVVLVRGTEAQAHAIKEQTAQFMREQMRLTLSPEKTAITHVDDGFDLLGFRIKRRPWRTAGKHVAYTFPSERAVRDVMHRIKTLTKRKTTNLSLDALTHALNPILRGWANYYRHAASIRCFAYLSYYLWWRIIRWLRKKHPRLTWKQIRRKYWGRTWTGPQGARLAWPAEVPVTRYRYRGHRIPSPWAATRTHRATTRPESAVS